MRYIVSDKLKTGKILVKKSYQQGVLMKSVVELPVFDASAKAEIKIISPKKAIKPANKRNYMRQCKIEIDADEQLIFQSYFNDDDIESIYERSFGHLLRSFVGRKSIKPQKNVNAK